MIQKYSDAGNQNLQILDKAKNFNEWMYAEIKPFLKGNILELGSGRGTYSKKIINDFPDSKIILSDIDDNYISSLKSFIKYPNCSVLKIDLGDKSNFDSIPFPLDSAFALNVLEHVKDDVSALKNIYTILNNKGTLILLVPAHKFLFNCIDEDAGHFRRYSREDVLKKVAQTPFKIKKLFYFNFLSILGWFWNGSVLQKKVLNENAMTLFNSLVPSLRFIEKNIFGKKIGLSLIIVLEK